MSDAGSSDVPASIKAFPVKAAIRFATIAFLCLVASPTFRGGSQAFANPPQEPTLWCGANPGAECSFILWDGHGSRGFVVGARQSIPIGNAYLNFKYCMHAGTIHAPMPNWPACFHPQSRTATDNSGVIHPGTQG